MFSIWYGDGTYDEDEGMAVYLAGYAGIDMFESGDADLHLTLGPDYRGRGIGWYALKTLAIAATEAMNANHIYFCPFDGNNRAARCAEKVGFLLRGAQRTPGHSKKRIIYQLK